MRIRVIDSEAGLQASKECWQRAYLGSGTDNVFLSWEWTALWWRHYGAGHAIRVLVAEDESGVAGIVPFVVTPGGATTGWRPVVHFPGDEKLADYTDMLVVRDGPLVARAALTALCDWQDWGSVALRRLPDDSRVGASVRDALAAWSCRCGARLECESPYLTVAGPWPDYFAGRSKSLRQELRTSGNNLTRMGEWGFEVCRDGSLPAAREALYRFHLERQKRRPGASIFADEAGRAFTRDLTEACPAGWRAEVSVVRVGPRPVSAVLALRGQRTFYYWVPAFDASVPGASLGKLHLKLLIERAFADGCALVDLMIGDDRYKLDWATGARSNWRLVGYRDRRTAALAEGIAGLRVALRKLKVRSRTAQRAWTIISKLRPCRD